MYTHLGLITCGRGRWGYNIAHIRVILFNTHTHTHTQRAIIELLRRAWSDVRVGAVREFAKRYGGGTGPPRCVQARQVAAKRAPGIRVLVEIQKRKPKGKPHHKHHGTACRQAFGIACRTLHGNFITTLAATTLGGEQQST